MGDLIEVGVLGELLVSFMTLSSSFLLVSFSLEAVFDLLFPEYSSSLFLASLLSVPYISR